MLLEEDWDDYVIRGVHGEGGNRTILPNRDEDTDGRWASGRGET